MRMTYSALVVGFSWANAFLPAKSNRFLFRLTAARSDTARWKLSISRSLFSFLVKVHLISNGRYGPNVVN